MFKLNLEKAKERDQIAKIHWIIEKPKEFQKNIYFCFTDYAKDFDCVNCNKLWKILKRDGNTRPPDLPLEKSVCRSRSNRTRHGTTHWFQIGKGVPQGCILPPCLFNLYAEYIMQNADWMKHKQKSRLLEEISITSDMQMTPPLQQKVKTN